MNIPLYPKPCLLTRTGGSVTVPGALTIAGAPRGLVATIPGLTATEADAGWVRVRLDAQAPREAGSEAYCLKVTAGGVEITARTAVGARWGLVTLVQLLRACPETIPCLLIEDAPAFAERGFMLDISRDRVPTQETLYSLVDQMALLKLNHLQLYTEHTFAYAGHEVVWRNADPVTPGEMRALDAYALARGVVLTANQNSFGHFERWLCHPGYMQLAEIAEPWTYAPWGDCWRDPSTLCPLDPGSIALVEDLFRQLFPCCSGKYANIGGDEPVDLGEGRSRAACAERGRGRVFSDYLGQVLRVAQKLGKRPQFWCDPHPNEDNSLLKDLAVLVWGYGQQEDFASRLKVHAAAGREVWVAPGTNNWSSYTGRTDARRGNLACAAVQGLAAGAVGLLNTEWGDNGHRQQWPLALIGMADGAQAAWGGDNQFDDDAAGLQVFGSAGLGRWLAALGMVDRKVVFGYGSSSFNDGNAGWGNDADVASIPAWEEAAARFAELERSLPAVGGRVEEECRLAVGLARFAADRAVRRRQDSSSGIKLEFRRRLAPLCAAYRRQWLARSRYGGLEDSYTKVKSLLG
ncbi:MAG: family 20 glycosylhydrolase [bacterium]